MRNLVSRNTRRCGLCCFEMQADAPLLDQPVVSRRYMPNGNGWTDGPFDGIYAPLYSNGIAPAGTGTVGFVQLRTRLSAIHSSIDRGCTGCIAIWLNVKNQLASGDLSVDDKCMQDTCDLFWLIRRKSSSPSLQFELLAKNKNDAYGRVSCNMIVGYTGYKFGELCLLRIFIVFRLTFSTAQTIQMLGGCRKL